MQHFFRFRIFFWVSCCFVAKSILHYLPSCLVAYVSGKQPKGSKEGEISCWVWMKGSNNNLKTLFTSLSSRVHLNILRVQYSGRKSVQGINLVEKITDHNLATKFSEQHFSYWHLVIKCFCWLGHHKTNSYPISWSTSCTYVTLIIVCYSTYKKYVLHIQELHPSYGMWGSWKTSYDGLANNKKFLLLNVSGQNTFSNLCCNTKKCEANT